MDINDINKKKQGIIGVILFYIGLLLLLYFFGFRDTIPDTEEGVLISYGTVDAGSGTGQPVQAVQQPSPAETQPTPAVSKPTPAVVPEKAPETVKTQDFDDEAPEIKAGEEKPKVVEKPKPDVEEAKRKAEEEARIKKQKEQELIKQRELEEQRKKEAAELARRKKIQDELAKLDQERVSNQNTNSTSTVNNPFSGAGTDAAATGQGNTTFPGNQGSVNGDPNSNQPSGTGLGKSGNSFSLSGRKLSGKLPEPVYAIQEEGTVVIEIVVDASGRVVSATPKLKGSTTQNADLWKVAREAALKANFNADPNAPVKQVGTITYHFQLD